MKNKVILEGECLPQGNTDYVSDSSPYFKALFYKVPYVCEQHTKYHNLIKFDIETSTLARNAKTGKFYNRYDTHHIYVWNVTKECQQKLFLGTVVRIEGVLRYKKVKGKEQISVEATSIKVKVGNYFKDIKTGKF